MRGIKGLPKRFLCCFCKKTVTGPGNNAMPAKDGRCCNKCNLSIVIPTRLEQARKVIYTKCPCCRRRFKDVMNNRKFCGECADYLRTIIAKSNYYKNKFKKLKQELE